MTPRDILVHLQVRPARRPRVAPELPKPPGSKVLHSGGWHTVRESVR